MSHQPHLQVSYVAQLRQAGENISKEECLRKIEEIRYNDPCEAYKYFLEISEVFEGSPEHEIYSVQLLEAARQVRIDQAIRDGVTTGIVATRTQTQQAQAQTQQQAGGGPTITIPVSGASAAGATSGIVQNQKIQPNTTQTIPTETQQPQQLNSHNPPPHQLNNHTSNPEYHQPL